jgi:hypothetical protein
MAAQEAVAMDAAKVSTANAGARMVEGRAFRLQDGEWVDGLHASTARTVVVEPFSRAYFDVLSALPELGTWWSVLSPVVIAGRQVSIAVRAGGSQQLGATEIQRLTREFRSAR